MNLYHMDPTKYWWYLAVSYSICEVNQNLIYGSIYDATKEMKKLDSPFYGKNKVFFVNCLMPDGERVFAQGSDLKKVMSRIISKWFKNSTAKEFATEKSKQSIA